MVSSSSNRDEIQTQRFENRAVHEDDCCVTLGPPEKLTALHWGQNRTIENVECVNCELIGHGLASYGMPVGRAAMRNVRLERCRCNSFYGIGAIFDEVEIDRLRTGRHPVILSGCALRHVVIRGTCGRFLMNRHVCHDDADRNAAFDVDNAALYENVDWALDITDAKATCLEIHGAVPARLVRRNPREHVIMKRNVALSKDWKSYEPPVAFQVSVSRFIDSGADDSVFVAGHGKYFRDEIEYFDRLRSARLVT